MVVGSMYSHPELLHLQPPLSVSTNYCNCIRPDWIYTSPGCYLACSCADIDRVVKRCYLDLQKLQYPPLPDGFWENPDGLFKFKSLLARFLTSPSLCSQTCRRCGGGGGAAVITRSCTFTTSGSSWWWWRRRSAPGHRAVATSAPGRSGTRCWRGSRTPSSRASGLPFTWVRRTSLPASLWMIVKGAWT